MPTILHFIYINYKLRNRKTAFLNNVLTMTALLRNINNDARSGKYQRKTVILK
jgi:hypothetical protein